MRVSASTRSWSSVKGWLVASLAALALSCSSEPTEPTQHEAPATEHEPNGRAPDASHGGESMGEDAKSHGGDPQAPDDASTAPPDAGFDSAEDAGDGAQDDAVLEPSGCAPDRIAFQDGWKLQAAAHANGTGANISRVGFAAEGWHTTRVPSTVLAALVRDGTYPDPRVMDNHDRVPRAPFDDAWWYRYEFDVPERFAREPLELVLEGVSYRANVWLNGELIADRNEVVGTFVKHQLDVTGRVRAGERNVLAIEVFRPDPQRDLAITFHDWSPDAQDRGMGLWRGVFLERTGPVAVKGAYVVPDLSDDLQTARLMVVAEIENRTDQTVHAPVRVEFEGAVLEEEVVLNPREQKNVRFEPERHAALVLHAPRVWWPAAMGEQPLYALCVTAGDADAPSDKESVRFGVRETSSEIDAQGHRLFRVNGRRFFVKAAGWTSDMLLEFKSPERLDAELRYFLDLGLNTLRMEGKFEDEAFHRRADELGIMTLPGWMCCDRWEQWQINADWQNFEPWTPDVLPIAVRSTESAAELFRNHPSAIGFFLASDWAPPDPIADAYQDALRGRGFQGSILPSATHYETHNLKSGFKMTGPYDWVPPHYWFFPHNGGNFGFITESSPGPSIPELETLRNMLTPSELEQLWRNTAAPQLHAGGRNSDFESMVGLGDALRERHGAATSLADFVKKAQLLNYESERVPFEAYRRNKYERATGFVHWLLNAAWPSLIWNLYNYDLSTHAAYFGAKKGLTPLHITYSYDDRSVRVLNDLLAPQGELHARVRVYDIESNVRWEHEADLTVDADATRTLANVPEVAGISTTYFVALSLSRSGEPVSHNLYWLSTVPDVLDWAKTDWRRTPPSAFADFRQLNTMAKADVRVSASTLREGSEWVTRVVLKNESPRIALLVRALLTAGQGGAPVWPALWNDNYVSLEPGEERVLTVRYQASKLEGAAPVVVVSGYNVDPKEADG